MTSISIQTFMLSTYMALGGMFIDFGSEKQGSTWQVINDGVMGGLSEGTAFLSDDTMLFIGEISTKNNGGFSSVKSPFGSYSLSESSQLYIRYRSSGEPVAITLENHRAFYRPYFKLWLDGTDGEWKETTLDITHFSQYQMGRKTSTSIDDDYLERVIRIGLITGNKIEGSFEFELDYIRFE